MDHDQLEYEYLQDNNNFSFYSLIHYIKNNIIQILMLVLVIIIVLVVDYISHINASIYGLPSAIPGLSGATSITNNNNNNRPSQRPFLPKENFRKQKKPRN